MNISEAVAQRVRELLKANNLTQYKLEQKSCIPHETLKSIMKSKTKGVNLKTIVAIADGFGMSVSDFLNSPLFTYDNLNMD